MLAAVQKRLGRPPEHARRDSVEIGDRALASGNEGSGTVVGGKKAVRVFAGRDREGCLVVLYRGGGEAARVG